MPREAITSIRAPTTRLREIEVSRTFARHSRVTSSPTLNTRNQRPLANWSWTKSRLQRWLGSAATGAGARAPTTGLRPFLRGQTFFAIAQAAAVSGALSKASPLGLLAVDRDGISLQQDMQAAITEPTALTRQNAQLFTQLLIITAADW